MPIQNLDKSQSEICKKIFGLKTKYNLSGLDFKAIINYIADKGKENSLPENFASCEEIYIEIYIRSYKQMDIVEWTMNEILKNATENYKLTISLELYSFILTSFREYKEVLPSADLYTNLNDFYCFMDKIFDKDKSYENIKPVYPFLEQSINFFKEK